MTRTEIFKQFLSFDKDRFEKDLEAFVANTREEALSKACEGWLFSKHYDQEFSSASSSKRPVKKSSDIKVKTKSKTPAKPAAPKSEDIDFFSEILQIPDTRKCWEYVQNLITLEHKAIRQDSFGEASSKEAKAEATRFLSEKELNIVIIGAGCMGLYVANFLKNKLGDFANILVCENRASEARIKKPYSRDWITNIHISFFEDYFDPKLIKIFRKLGSDDFIGTTINALETLMLLSSKDLGISFYFEPDMELDFIEKSGASLIIDTTAGKIDYLYPKADSLLKEINVKQEKEYEEDFSYAGVHPYESAKHPVLVNLKLQEGRYYPYLDDKRIHYPMFKMTKIPVSYLDKVLEFVSKKNQDNIFYVWRGRLNHEINEVLVLINLQESGFNYLAKHMTKRVSLQDFIEITNTSKKGVIDDRVKDLAKFITNLDKSCDSAKVEPPFRYEPNIKLLPQGITRVFSKPIIPMGDSYYPGHVKVGNGLGYHTYYAMKFSEMVLSSIMAPIDNILQAAITHHQAGEIEEARSLYSLILKANDKHSDANHNLGVLMLNTDNPQSSLDYFKKALRANPQIEQYWISLIEVLAALKMTDDARAVLKQARDFGINSNRLESVASTFTTDTISFG